MTIDHRRKARTFLAARGGQRRQHGLETFEQRGVTGGERFSVHCFRRGPAVGQGQQAVETRQLDALPKHRRAVLRDLAFRHVDQGIKHGLVDAGAGIGGIGGNGQCEIERAPRKEFGGGLTGGQFERIETVRRADTDIERLAVDALGFPRPGERRLAVETAFGTGEARHAGQCNDGQDVIPKVPPVISGGPGVA